MPGLAIAEVRPENKVFLSYEVCQSQTNDWMTTYGNPYSIAPDVASVVSLNKTMRTTGTQIYTKTLKDADQYGCDSTVIFTLTVLPPPHFDTTFVTTNLHGTTCKWLDSTFTTHGQHAYLHTLPDGCDSLNLVNFIILQVDTSTNQFCEGDSTTMGVMVTEPPMAWRTDYIRPKVSVGDIVCTDSTIMDVETFLKGYPDHEKKPKGVVFYVDSTGEHGLIMALKSKQLGFLSGGNYLVYERGKVNSFHDAADWPFVMDGYYRTQIIKQYSYSVPPSDDFRLSCPGVAYCYYYDPDLLDMGEEHKGWWMPASGEISLLYANREEVAYVLKKMKNEYNNSVTRLSDVNKGYWTTTNTWWNNMTFQYEVVLTASGLTGQVLTYYPYNTGFSALPITSF